MSDMAIGTVVLVGDYNWRKGPMWPSIVAMCIGRRQRFVHLGMRCTIAWYKEQPYLIALRQAPEAKNGG